MRLKNSTHPAIRRLHRVLMLILIVVGASHGIATVDLNSDGISDIWALKYNAEGLDPNGDADGDGITNRSEAIAGTNPFSAQSTIGISAMVLDANGLSLTFPTQLGKGYQIQRTSSLSPAVWQNVSSQSAGTGSNLTVVLPPDGATSYFYRVQVLDKDSDGDGVNDWEEITLGFDPNSAYSGGLSGLDDYTRVVQALQATSNVVSIVAVTPHASEAGPVPGALLVTRVGNLKPITVNYTVSGTATPGSDYVPLSGSVTLGFGVNSATIVVTPVADSALESDETVTVTLASGLGYTIGSPAAATVLISDATQPNGTGLMAQFWEEGSLALGASVLPTFTGTPVNGGIYAGLNQTTASWGTTNANGSHPSGVGADLYWSSRWTGEVLPQYSQQYTFSLETNYAGRLYVNGQLVVNNWPPTVTKSSSDDIGTPTTNRAYGTIDLVGGVRYAVIIEHYQDAGTGRCYLRWQSANQPEEYVPATRLFPNPPPQIISTTDVVLLKNSGTFNYQILASGNPTSYGATNLPTGWSVTTGGLISGSPTQAGVWQIPITATNSQGSGSAILTLTVVDTGGAITRDVWTTTPGGYPNVAALPLTTTPDSTGMVTALEGPQNPGGVDYGSRLRGYLYAPKTGAYQFWITGNDNAELWISNDEEPINLFQRALTSGPTGYREWANANTGKSDLLYLEAGQRYYVEVRHVDVGANGHVSVGWFKPGDAGAGTTPTEVVPAYALSPWVTPTGQTSNGTLYLASLVPQGSSVTIASGLSTIRLSAGGTEANIVVNYSNLSSSFVGMHVHDDLIPNPPGGLANVVCDIDQPGDATKEPDGSYRWILQPRAGFTAADIAQHLATGHLYFNIHSTNYPSGEIKGYFRLLAGAQTFTAPSLQTWVDPTSAASTESSLNANGAARFLNQATFGATSAEIANVQSLGFEGWIDDQLNLNTHPVTHHRDYVLQFANYTNPNSPVYYTDLTTNSWWKNSITATDQLRQRMAFAMSQITVISSSGVLEDQSTALTAYYDTLLDKAGGNFKDLLKAVTLSPAMGIYLDMRKNDKPNITTGLHANENYAREIQQLFSIGLYRLWPDGTLMLNSKGDPIETYGQDEITGMANALTGWNYNQADVGGFYPTSWSSVASDYVNPMKQVPSHHFTGQKRILNNVVLPGLPTLPSLAGNPVLDPYATHTTQQIQTPEYQALPAAELDATHNALFKHPNAGPFICRQLIQRFVTSTPSRGYLYRVVQAFNGERNVHGIATGVRGDMKEVIKAILLDYEARSNVMLSQQGYGKQREPVLRVTGPVRAFAPPKSVAGTYVQDGGAITVTAPNLLASGNALSLDFSGAGTQSTSGVYSVSGAFPISSSSFVVRTKDVIRSTYTQSGTTVTVWSGNVGSVTHGYLVGDSTFLRFRDGTGKPADGRFTITSVADTTHFTVEVPTTATISTAANCDVASIRGQYDQSGTTLTLTSATVHGLANGTNVTLTFDPKTGQTTTPAAGTYPITYIDATHFSVTVPDSVSRSGNFNAGPDSPTLDRSGTAITNFQNWGVGGTDTTLGQTPMRSPTVFNFYMPDFQFPGDLADAGLITPEFQLTSDTNVIRQVNFLFGGVFSSSSGTSSGNTTGLTSFKDGGGNIAMDFSPWMGIKPGSTVAWTNDRATGTNANNGNNGSTVSNLSDLIDQLNTILLGGQLPAAAKTKIVNYVTAFNTSNSTYSNISYSNYAPTDTQKRDRIRAIVHLIITSADYTIQK